MSGLPPRGPIGFNPASLPVAPLQMILKANSKEALSVSDIYDLLIRHGGDAVVERSYKVDIGNNGGAFSTVRNSGQVTFLNQDGKVLAENNQTVTGRSLGGRVDANNNVSVANLWAWYAAMSFINNGSVEINGENNTITAKDNDTVSVNGSTHTLTVDNSKELRVKGSGHTVNASKITTQMLVETSKSNIRATNSSFVKIDSTDGTADARDNRSVHFNGNNNGTVNIQNTKDQVAVTGSGNKYTLGRNKITVIGGNNYASKREDNNTYAYEGTDGNDLLGISPRANAHNNRLDDGKGAGGNLGKGNDLAEMRLANNLSLDPQKKQIVGHTQGRFKLAGGEGQDTLTVQVQNVGYMKYYQQQADGTWKELGSGSQFLQAAMADNPNGQFRIEDTLNDNILDFTGFETLRLNGLEDPNRPSTPLPRP